MDIVIKKKKKLTWLLASSILKNVCLLSVASCRVTVRSRTHSLAFLLGKQVSGHEACN